MFLIDLLAALLVGREREHGHVLHKSFKAHLDIVVANAHIAAFQGRRHVGSLVVEIGLEDDVVDHNKKPAKQLAVERLPLMVAESSQHEIFHPAVVHADVFQTLVGVKR